MNNTPTKAERIAKQFTSKSATSRTITTILCPSFTGLASVNSVIKKSKRKDILLGAQNCFWEGQGAFTGEESLDNLHTAGCKAVIVGHSERRIHFMETNEMVGKKFRAVLTYPKTLVPIDCIGETRKERSEEKTSTILHSQLTALFKSVHELTTACLIAYEPVWAIGTGVSITPNDCARAIKFIRSTIAKLLPPVSMKNIHVLYGGSITPENTLEIMYDGLADGLLIGGTSLDVKKLIAIQEKIL